MNSKWPMVRLGDHVDACLGKMLDAKKNKGLPQPYLGNSNVRWGSFNLEDLAEMRFEPHEEDRYGLMPGDLVVCEGGEPGRCAIWTAPVPSMKIQKALHRIRPKVTLNNYYLYYWFCYSSRAGLLDPYFTGTTIKHLTGKAIANLELPLPPIETQTEMVDVLRALDDRITLLRETNATLEAIAQALFKSWFVDFDPVRAKQQGLAPEGMDDETAALFPDGFEESALGLVPKGWRAATIGAVSAQIFSGGTPDTRKPEYWAGDIPWFSSGETRNRIIVGTEKWISPLAVESSSTKLSTPGDVLIASAGQGHTRGQTSYNAIRTYINQSVVAVRANQEICEPLWLYYDLSRRYEEMRNLSDSHSSRGSLTTKLLAGMPVILPSRNICSVFAAATNTMIAAQIGNERQAQTLSALRDTLLPRLIFGQLRLPEAETFLEEVL